MIKNNLCKLCNKLISVLLDWTENIQLLCKVKLLQLQRLFMRFWVGIPLPKRKKKVLFDWSNWLSQIGHTISPFWPARSNGSHWSLSHPVRLQTPNGLQSGSLVWLSITMIFPLLTPWWHVGKGRVKNKSYFSLCFSFSPLFLCPQILSLFSNPTPPVK